MARPLLLLTYMFDLFCCLLDPFDNQLQYAQEVAAGARQKNTSVLICPGAGSGIDTPRKWRPGGRSPECTRGASTKAEMRAASSSSSSW